jgi:hypothetical protein
VRHFWLCKECSRELTLEYQDGQVVLLNTSAEAESLCLAVAG